MLNKSPIYIEQSINLFYVTWKNYLLAPLKPNIIIIKL